MIDWLAIIFLLLIGVGLIVLELIFIPGTTLFGLAGIGLGIAGVVLSFINHGMVAGLLVSGITLIATAAVVYVSLKSGTWDKLSLKRTHNSRVNEEARPGVWKGDTGKTLSSLRPSGNVEFNGHIVEVTTRGEYVSSGTPVRVIEVEDNRIWVVAISDEQTDRRSHNG